MAGGCSPGISSSADPEQNSSPPLTPASGFPTSVGAPGSIQLHRIEPWMPTWAPPFAISQILSFPPLGISQNRPLRPSYLLQQLPAVFSPPVVPKPLPPTLTLPPAASHHTLLCWRYTRQRVSPPQTARVIPFPQNLLYPTAARKILIPPPKLASNAASLGKTSLCPQDPRVLRSRLCYKT